MKCSKEEIINAFNYNMELFEDTTAGQQDCIKYTAESLELTFRQVERAVFGC